VSRVLLSAAARLDRRQVSAYTVERFGVLQARRLRDRLEATLDLLADTPLVGRTNDELDPPGHEFRCFPVMRSIVIVYEPTDAGIRVARLLHGARQLAKELDRDAGDSA
jgi:toxin ParE1/3/4